MPCTTILIGKKATYDGSTMIARTEDGMFDVKRMVIVEPEQQPRKYKCIGGHLEIELPDDPMRYSACPNVDLAKGTWAATGINAANVGMTATETITTNPRVLGADPLLDSDDENTPCGIGEEDLVVLVLPYVRSAREAVLRLGSLQEQYGTYETNGIAFNDEHEVWWFETIGGHHWIAKRVGDEECVIAPNQFALDNFDFADAYGAQESCLCSADLKEFVEKYHLDLNTDGHFNPRYAFGSHTDKDHLYNTPRAWFMGRYLCPTTYRWDGPDADFTPESDDIPWSLIPEKKLTPEDVKYLLSSYYQGTPYNPFSASAEKKGIYRTIGINRTGVMGLCQIRSGVPETLKGVQWVCFGPTTYDAMFPVYTNVPKLPDYLSNVTTEPAIDNFYWNSRMIAALADPHYADTIAQVERYQNTVAAEGHRLLNEYDAKVTETGDLTLLEEANDKLCAMAQKQTAKCLKNVLQTATEKMRIRYSRGDY